MIVIGKTRNSHAAQDVLPHVDAGEQASAKAAPGFANTVSGCIACWGAVVLEKYPDTFVPEFTVKERAQFKTWL